MITLIVFIILILFFVYLFNALFGSGLTFFINICIIFLTAVRARAALKKEKIYGTYLASALLTVIFFIAKDVSWIKPVFDFLYRAYILDISIALVSIVFFANMMQLVRANTKRLIVFCKKKLAEYKK